MKILDLTDRFARGLVAGFVASLCQTALNLFAYFVIHVPGGRYYNFGTSMILGKKSSTLFEAVFGQIVQIGFATGAAVIFAYVILGINSKNHLIKGVLWGLCVWFLAYSTIVYFHIATNMRINVYSATSNAITSALWGVLMAAILRWLDNRVPETAENKKVTKKFRLSPVPARKPKLEQPEQPEQPERKLRRPVKLSRMKH